MQSRRHETTVLAVLQGQHLHVHFCQMRSLRTHVMAALLPASTTMSYVFCVDTNLHRAGFKHSRWAACVTGADMQLNDQVACKHPDCK